VTARTDIDLETVPRLAPHMRLRFDQTRQTWAVQAPERTFMLDTIAHAIISRCDGATSIVGVVDGLCVAFPGAPRGLIEKDVLVLLQRFADKGVVIA
jgi:pyrroloquinoline quinone biosynthesis protein D